MELLNKKYKVIYVDPPWNYRNKKTGGTHMISSAESKYKTMNLDDLKSFSINDFASYDCILFLWATVPLLDEAFELIKSWNFTYKTSIFWRKILDHKLGLGHWFRGEVELCLVGIKGNIEALRNQRSNFIQSHARRHSQKPIEMYELIENSCKNLNPKIELFARNRRNGWDSWGNELSESYDDIWGDDIW